MSGLFVSLPLEVAEYDGSPVPVREPAEFFVKQRPKIELERILISRRFFRSLKLSLVYRVRARGDGPSPLGRAVCHTAKPGAK